MANIGRVKDADLERFTKNRGNNVRRAEADLNNQLLQIVVILNAVVEWINEHEKGETRTKSKTRNI